MAQECAEEPDIHAKWLEGRAEAGRKATRTKLGWCPPEHLADYLYLCRQTRKMTAAEAKAAILARLTPFERAMERVRNGASISIKPVIRRAEPQFTLGGVSSL